MKDLHAVQFDGMTFGMSVEINTAAWRHFKKQVKWEKCINQFGREFMAFTVPYLALGAIMCDAHWLVTERKSFDRICIDDYLGGAVIYVKYTDQSIDFRHRLDFKIAIEKEITDAVQHLGITTKNLHILPIAYTRYEVRSYGKVIGIYDTDKHTFVD